MASYRASLLLAAACCAALAGCPKVTGLKGQAFEVSEGPDGVVETGLAHGAGIDEGATIRVEAGATVTIEFDDGCAETYGAGTHTVTNPCAAEEDSNDLDRDDADEDADEESRGQRDSRGEEPATRDPSQATVPRSSALATSGVVLGTVAGIVAITEASGGDDDAPPPLSP